MIEYTYYDGNTMNNLIDRVDFIQSLKSGMSAMDVIEALLKFPPAEAKPVVRGKWVYKDGYPRCSVCGHQLMDEENFCPNCGADMRGADGTE